MSVPILQSGRSRSRWGSGLRRWRLAISAIAARLWMCAICPALRLAVENCAPGEVYNLGGDDIYSVEELVEAVREQVNFSFAVEQRPADEVLRRTGDGRRQCEVSEPLCVDCEDSSGGDFTRHAGVVESAAWGSGAARAGAAGGKRPSPQSGPLNPGSFRSDRRPACGSAMRAN